MATWKKPLLSQKSPAKMAVVKINVSPPSKKQLTSNILSPKIAIMSSNDNKIVRKEISKSTVVTNNLEQINEKTTKLDDKSKSLIKSTIEKSSAKSSIMKRGVTDFTQKASSPVKINRPLIKELPKSIKKQTTSLELKPKLGTVTNSIGTMTKISLVENKPKIFASPVKSSATTVSKFVNSKPKIIPKVIKPTVIGSTIVTKSKDRKPVSTVISATKSKLSSAKETSKLVLKSTANTNAVVKKPITHSRLEMKSTSNPIEKSTLHPIFSSKTSNASVIRPRLTKGIVNTKNMTKMSPVVEIRDADSTSSFNACSSIGKSQCKSDQVLNFDENRAYEVAERLYEVMKMPEDITKDVITSVKVLEPEFKVVEMSNTGVVDSFSADENEINLKESNMAFTNVETKNISEITKEMEDNESILLVCSNVSVTGNEKTENMEYDLAEKNVKATKLEEDMKVFENIDKSSESSEFKLFKDQCICHNVYETYKKSAENMKYDQAVEDNNTEVMTQDENSEDTEEKQKNDLLLETESQNDEVVRGTVDIENMNYSQEIAKNVIDTEENTYVFENEDEILEYNQEIVSKEEGNDNCNVQDVLKNENDGNFNEDNDDTVDEETSNSEGNESVERLDCGEILSNDIPKNVEYEIYDPEENDQINDTVTQNCEKFNYDSLDETLTSRRELNNFYKYEEQQLGKDDQTEDIKNHRRTSRKSKLCCNNVVAKQNTITGRENDNVSESEIQNVKTDDLISLNEAADKEKFSRIKGLCFGNVLPLTSIIETTYSDFDKMQDCLTQKQNKVQSSNLVTEDKKNFEIMLSVCGESLEAVTDLGFVAKCEFAPETQNDDVDVQENYFCENIPNSNTESIADSENSDDQCNSEGFVVVKTDEDKASIATFSFNENVNEAANNTSNGSNDGISYAAMVKTPPRTPLDNCSVELDDQFNYRAEILDDETFYKMSIVNNDFESFSFPIVIKEPYSENYPESITNECEDFVDINIPIPVSELEHRSVETSTEEQQNFTLNEEDRSANYADDDGYKTIRRKRNRRNKKNKGQRRYSLVEHYDTEPLAEIQENVFDDNSHYRRKNSRRMKSSPKKHFRGTVDSFIDSSYFYANPVWKSYYTED